MARFNVDGLDDLGAELEMIEIDCPECGRSFEVHLDDLGESMTCPHCHAEIETELN